MPSGFFSFITLLVLTSDLFSSLFIFSITTSRAILSAIGRNWVGVTSFLSRIRLTSPVFSLTTTSTVCASLEYSFLYSLRILSWISEINSEWETPLFIARSLRDPNSLWSAMLDFFIFTVILFVRVIKGYLTNLTIYPSSSSLHILSRAWHCIRIVEDEYDLPKCY